MMPYGKCIECNHNSNNNCLIYNGPPSNPNRSYSCAYYVKKQTHLQNERGQNMKKGDVVQINDCSWARTAKNGKLVSPNGVYGVHCIVVEINCKFPFSLPRFVEQSPTYNNTVIQVIDTGEVIFIEQRFLKPVTRKITFDDGKVVELSEQSYQNLRKQLL